MDKVWFKLRQTHYPPPPHSSIMNGVDGVDAPLRIGHFINDLKSIDFVLNVETIENFPASMRVFHTRMTTFTWDTERSTMISGSIEGSVPIAAAMGTTLGASIKEVFQQSISNHEEYEALDTYIVQPTQSYIEKCLSKAPLNHHLRWFEHKTLFMITGLCVARQGTRKLAGTRAAGGGFDMQADIPAIVGVNTGLHNAKTALTTIGGQPVTDFVFAVRLAKVHKARLSTDWSLKTYNKGATFTMNDEGEEVNITEVLNSHGLPQTAITVIEDEHMDCAIVLQEH